MFDEGESVVLSSLIVFAPFVLLLVRISSLADNSFSMRLCLSRIGVQKPQSIS